MKQSYFRAFLKARGYNNNQILALQRFGYESAKDAHESEKENFIDFKHYVMNIGRDFVVDNIDDLVIDDDGNVTWSE